MPVVGITTELQDAAREVHRRRLLSNSSGRIADFRATVAETAFVSLYGDVPLIDHLKVGKRSLEMIPTDEDGHSIRVCWWSAWPLRVFSRLLDADVYVFVVQQSPTNLDIAGWLPINLVEEAPVHWFEKDGERLDYSHEIDRDYLIPLPADFAFKDECIHQAGWMCLWDWTFDAWQCSGCGRYVHDAQGRERAVRDLDRQRNPIPTDPRGS